MKQSFLKVASLLALVSVLSATLLTPLAHAQATDLRSGTWWNPTSTEFLKKVDGAADNEIFGERYTYAQVNWIIHSLVAILAGPIANCAASGAQGSAMVSCVADALQAGNGGAVLPLAMGIDIFQRTKPTSGVDYVAGKLEKFNLVDESYAQQNTQPTVDQAGFGFTQSLAIIQPIWLGVRDASYSLVIFAILILAFMVMLRAKISPQASITVQAALPRIALGLVMITFSYAIAGFMVDLAYVTMGLLSGILASSSITGGNGNALDIFRAMDSVGGSVLAYMISFMFAIFPLIGLNAVVGGGAYMALATGQLGLVAGVVLILVLLVVMVVALVRIFWLQLMTFTKLLMLVIASPLLMLIGIVRSGTISSWLRNIAAQLTVFVAISVMVMLAHVILYTTNRSVFGGASLDDLSALFEPLLRVKINSFGITSQLEGVEGAGFFPGGFSFGSVNVLGMFVSFGIIMSIPSMASAARDAVLTGKGNFGFDSFGTALGGAGTIGLASLPARQYIGAVEADAKRANKTPWDYLKGMDKLKWLGAQGIKQGGGYLSRK